MKELTKICKGCGQEMPLTEYSDEKRNKDGKNGKCKKCITEEAHNRRSTSAYKEQMKLKRQDPEFKAKKALQDRLYREKINESRTPKKPKPKMAEEERKERKAKSDKRYAEKNKKRIAEYQRQYRVDNSEKLKEVRAEYTAREEFLQEERDRRRKLREREPERIKADKRREYLEHIEQYKITARAYRNSDRGRAIAVEASARYRSKLQHASDGTVTEESLKLLKDVQDCRCAYCLTDLGEIESSKVHLDHIYPISKGGIHSITNVVWSCASCNLRKSDSVIGWDILTERIEIE